MTASTNLDFRPGNLHPTSPLRYYESQPLSLRIAKLSLIATLHLPSSTRRHSAGNGVLGILFCRCASDFSHTPCQYCCFRHGPSMRIRTLPELMCLGQASQHRMRDLPTVRRALTACYLPSDARNMRHATSTTANAHVHPDSEVTTVQFRYVDRWQMETSGYPGRAHPVIVRMDGKASTATYVRPIGHATL